MLIYLRCLEKVGQVSSSNNGVVAKKCKQSVLLAVVLTPKQWPTDLKGARNDKFGNIHFILDDCLTLAEVQPQIIVIKLYVVKALIIFWFITKTRTNILTRISWNVRVRCTCRYEPIRGTLTCYERFYLPNAPNNISYSVIKQ